MLRDGETLESLIKDAQDCNMSHQIGVFAGIRLAEYYKAVREGRLLPPGMTSAMYPMMQPMWGQMAAQPPPSPTSYHQNGKQSSNEPSAADLERLANRPETIDLNTDASNDGEDLSYFFDQEDNEE